MHLHTLLKERDEFHVAHTLLRPAHLLIPPKQLKLVYFSAVHWLVNASSYVQSLR